MKINIELTDYAKEILNKVSDITITHYNETPEDIIGALEDLLSGYEALKEKFDDYKSQVENPSEWYEEEW